MKHEVTKLQNSQTEISMVFEENEWKQATKKAFDKIVANLEVPGFRKGHVPEAIAKARIDNTKMYNTAIDSLLSDAYRNVVAEEKIVPWARPNVEVTKMSETELEIKISVLTAPEVKLGQYKGHHVDKKIPTVSKEQIDDEIKRIQAQNAEIILKDGPAAIGDTVVIDFEGFVDGEAFAHGKAEGHHLELGSNTFIPGFEEQVVGLECGQTKDVEVTFPESYGNKELAGKPAVFKVTLREIKEQVLPELDEEFAKDAGLESIEDLRTKILESITSQESDRIEKDFRERLSDALIEANPIDLPETMVESQLEYMLQNLQNRMQSQGMRLEDMGINAASFKQIYREIAVKQVKSSLIMEAIALQENLKVEEDDIKDKLDEIIETSGAPKEMVLNFYSSDEKRRGLVSQLAEEKVVAFLSGKAKIEMVDKQSLDQAQMAEE